MKSSGYVNEAPVFGDSEPPPPELTGLPEAAALELPPPWVGRQIMASTADALNHIHHLHAGSTGTLGFTSALRGEGRTTIALAAAIAERFDFGRKTVLVDLDFTKPSLGTRTGALPCPGLAEYLRGEAALADCICWQDDRLGVIPAGAVDDEAEDLTSAFLRTWALDQIALHAEVVVADLPPLPPNGAGARLAAAFASVVLVVRSGVTSSDVVETAVRSLPTPPPAILNRLERPGSKRRRRLAHPVQVLRRR